MNEGGKQQLDKRGKLMVVVLFLIAIGFYVGFIAMTAIAK